MPLRDPDLIQEKGISIIRSHSIHLTLMGYHAPALISLHATPFSKDHQTFRFLHSASISPKPFRSLQSSRREARLQSNIKQSSTSSQEHSSECWVERVARDRVLSKSRCIYGTECHQERDDAMAISQGGGRTFFLVVSEQNVESQKKHKQVAASKQTRKQKEKTNGN